MWLSRALSSSFSSVLARCAKCMRQSRSCLWLCQIFTYLKKNSLRDSAINLSYFCLLKSSPHLKYVTGGIFQWTKCKSAKIWHAPGAVTGGPCHGRLSLRLQPATPAPTSSPLVVRECHQDARSGVHLVSPGLLQLTAVRHQRRTILRRLQSVQNAAARLVTGARRCDHITPVLRQLH